MVKACLLHVVLVIIVTGYMIIKIRLFSKKKTTHLKPAGVQLKLNPQSMIIS